MAKKVQAEFEIRSTDKGNTLKARRKELDQLGASYQSTEKASRRTAAAAAEYDYKQSQGVRGTAAAGRNMSKLAQTIDGGPNSLVSAYATLAANAFAVSAAFSALREAKQTEIVMKGLEIQGARTGRTLSLVAQSLQEISKGGLSGTQAMQVTALGTAAGFTRKDLESLVEVANDAAAALGRNLPDSVDRIIKGVTKLEPELLDELGLMTKLGEAQDKYAKELNKTAASLTSFEKRQAMLNAVVAEGTLKYDGLTEAIGGNPYDRIAASFDKLVKSITTGITTVLEFTGVLQLLGANMNTLAGVTVLFGSTIIPKLLGEFGVLADTSAKNALSAREDAAAQKEKTKTYLASARATIDQAKANANLSASQAKLSKRAQVAVPEALIGDTKKSEEAIKTLTSSIRGYEGRLTRLKKEGLEATDPKYLQVEENKRATQALINNIKTLQNAEDEYTRNSQTLGLSRIAQFSAQQIAVKETAKADAIYAAGNFELGEATRGVTESVRAYSRELVVGRIEAKQQAKIAGNTVPTYGLLSKAYDTAKVSSYGLVLGLRTLGTALLSVVPYIGIAITAWGIFKEFLTTEEDKKKAQALQDLNAVLENTASTIEYLNKITRSSAAGLGATAFEVISAQSAAMVELADAYANATKNLVELDNASATLERKGSIRAWADVILTSLPIIGNLTEQQIARQELLASQTGISADSPLFKQAKELEGILPGLNEEEKQLIQTQARLIGLEKELGESVRLRIEATEGLTNKQRVLNEALQASVAYNQKLNAAVTSLKSSMESAETAQSDFIKSLSPTTKFDAILGNFTELNSTLEETQRLLGDTDVFGKSFSDLLTKLGPNIRELMPAEVRDRLQEAEGINKRIVDLELQKAKAVAEGGESSERALRITKELEGAQGQLRDIGKQITPEVLKTTKAQETQLRNAQLQAIQAQSLVTLEQARLEKMQRGATISAADLKRQIDQQNKIKAQQAEIIKTEAAFLEARLAVQQADVDAARAKLLNAQNETEELRKQNRLIELRAANSALLYSTDEETRRVALETKRRLESPEGLAAPTPTAELQRSLDMAEAAAKLTRASINSAMAQASAITMSQTGAAEALAQTQKITLQNNIDNSEATQKNNALTVERRRVEFQIANILSGRTINLAEELVLLQSQTVERKKSLIAEKAAQIARIRLDRQEAVAQGKPQESLLEYDRREKLAREELQASLALEDSKTKLQIIQSSINLSVEESIKRQQDALKVLQDQLSASEQLLNQELELEQIRARIAAKRVGSELDPITQQVLEKRAAEAQYRAALDAFELRKASIEAEYALLEAQRIVQVANLRSTTLIAEAIASSMPEQTEAQRVAKESALFSIASAKNAANILEQSNYEIIREQRIASERLNIERLRLLKEEASIFNFGPSNPLLGALANITTVLKKPTLPETRTGDVKFVSPDLEAVKNSNNDQLTFLREIAETIRTGSFSSIPDKLDTIVKELVKQGGATPTVAPLLTQVRGSQTMAQTMAEAIAMARRAGAIENGFEYRSTSSAHGGRGHREGRAIDVSLAPGAAEVTDPAMNAKARKLVTEYVKKGFTVLFDGLKYQLDREGNVIATKYPASWGAHKTHLHVEASRAGIIMGEQAATKFSETVAQSRPSVAEAFADWNPSNDNEPIVSETTSKTIDTVNEKLGTNVERIEQAKLGLQEYGEVAAIIFGGISSQFSTLAENLDEVGKAQAQIVIALSNAMSQFSVNIPKLEEVFSGFKTGIWEIQEGGAMKTLGGDMMGAGTGISGSAATIEEIIAGSDMVLAGFNKISEGQEKSKVGFESMMGSASVAFSTISSLIGATASILKASSDAKIAAIDREIAAEQKRDGKSAQSVEKIKALEAKKDQFAKKSFNTQKKLMLAQAVMSTAAGVTMALASVPAPFSYILAGITAAMGAAQIAIISGMQYQSAAPSGTSMPSTLSIGKRGENVNLASGPSQIAGGEVGYLRGARGTGTSATDYRTVGSAYGGELMRGYGNRGFVVGEKGPEVISPETPINVTPANDTQQSAPINATINIQALDSSDVQRVLVDQRGNIISMLREAANSVGSEFLEQVNVNAYTRPQVGKL